MNWTKMEGIAQPYPSKRHCPATALPAASLAPHSLRRTIDSLDRLFLRQPLPKPSAGAHRKRPSHHAWHSPLGLNQWRLQRLNACKSSAERSRACSKHKRDSCRFMPLQDRNNLLVRNRERFIRPSPFQRTLPKSGGSLAAQVRTAVSISRFRR